MNPISTTARQASASGLPKEKLLLLTAAFISFVLSVLVWFFIDKDAGVFVGIWVPSILSLGTFLQTDSKGV